MTIPDPQRGHRLAAACAVAVEAGLFAQSRFRAGGLAVDRKGPQDVSSDADREVEALIRRRLAALFPEDGFLGEESGFAPARSGRIWVVDPIDGSWCFVHGIRAWCVSVAAVDEAGMELGVVYDAEAGELFAAARGLGATLNGRPLRVASAQSLGDGTVSVGFSHRSRPEEVAPLIGELLRRGGLYHRHGSGALALAWTAAGRLIGYLEPHMNSWDALAGLLLVREAGGFATDLSAPGRLARGGAVVAGAPGVRSALEELAARYFRQDPPPPPNSSAGAARA